MTSLFHVRALVCFRLDSRRVLPGCEVHVEAQTAAELIRDGRARLVDEADLGPLMDQLPASGGQKMALQRQ